MICSDAVAENSNDRKLYGTELYSTKIAADICLPKMVAGLLSHPKRQFYPSENNIPGETLPTKTPDELPSTEQIFTEISRLVPLFCYLLVL